MNLLEKTDEEIVKIANPIWENLIRSSNNKDYGSFTKDFSSQMLYGANEVELGKQWANNKLLTSLKDNPDYIIIFAWHYGKEIIQYLKKMGLKSKFILPLPNVKII